MPGKPGSASGIRWVSAERLKSASIRRMAAEVQAWWSVQARWLDSSAKGMACAGGGDAVILAHSVGADVAAPGPGPGDAPATAHPGLPPCDGARHTRGD